MYNKLHIYYFTGTGNALAVANWIANVAKSRQLKVTVEKITPSLTVDSSTIKQNTLIGFCYPTHGFNAPPIVVNFLLRFPKSKNNIFLVNTRAGMKLSKLFMPGLSGLAQLVPALILKSKGYKIIGVQPMDLPSNWISLHPGLRQKVVDSVVSRCRRITQTFSEKILTGMPVYKGLQSLPIDLLISPISVAYFFYGRFALAKTFIADYNCNSCRICEKECPVHAVEMKNNRPFWTRKCESCMHCMNVCPQRAIQTPHFFTFVIWWLVFSVVPFFILSELVKHFPAIANHYQLIFYSLILFTGIPIIFASYNILHFLMRFRFFSRFITLTSLTHFKFWRRYFASKKYINPTAEF